ncbi:RcnB family protein [Sphingomonas morindae]|uniref:RcnB family protein n=1 Tax=Sphingomonas morindae TaxID=1541170 RepID=A0ABY4XB10_9SPHN|nr:RcnB family protein [Sphingomonas morindae]USI74161.1 RcnB family protein [Sphingomonas morindae]
MRRLIFGALLAATLAPAAMAQSYGEVRRDDRDVARSQRDLDRAYARGDRDDIRDARADLRDARAERREDWRDFRRSHPDVYRGPAYVGPTGDWRYRPINPGYRFEPAYYQRRYWIDPARYRLPAVYGPQRWVRYGNDVALVDIRSGRVLRVYPRFFY